ncbi:rhodanese [Bosea sp. Root381]|uniref:PQQ-dependent catabolism-associated CXXCW motif protein n=1 Tax=Bosea sp. Root381 TaxID=1736524 RepID=UPI0006F83459|nr:PQQ-dependent catabolism-associated CXXCW motif protein [Bosea sp. Root381]KRE15794.1 rhodanese [Bosea sp. Root381]
MRRGLAVLMLCLATGLPARGVAQETPEEPAEYRTDLYRGPVPATLRGARVIDVEIAERLWRERSAIFIDVLPRPMKPANLPANIVWREPPHRSIPDAAWLANLGYGIVPEPLQRGFQARLETLTGRDRTRLLVFFCQRQCWMSWNAAKRAVSWGYQNVAWFPEGTDGWSDALLPLADVAPEP